MREEKRAQEMDGQYANDLRSLLIELLSSEGVEEEDVPFGTHVPFGPMLAVAGLVYFLGFHLYVDAYFADFVFNFLTP